MNKCPGCSHHCDRNNLQCGKGETIFKGKASPDSEHIRSHLKGKHLDHYEGKSHGNRHHRPNSPKVVWLT